MARWIDPATGHQMDSDTAAYGDQGDTTMWGGPTNPNAPPPSPAGPAPVVPVVPGVGGVVPGTNNSVSADFAAQMAQLARQAKFIGWTPPDVAKDRADRVKAALFANIAPIKEKLVADASLGDNWRQAVDLWANTGVNFTDNPNALEDYAVAQGFMPKRKVRTLAELVDERTAQILGANGLAAPWIQTRIDKQLEDAYQADLTGTPVPDMMAETGGARFLPTIPSAQAWGGFNPAEQAGVEQLGSAFGMTPAQLAAQIRRYAPPGGGSALASTVFRGARG